MRSPWSAESPEFRSFVELALRDFGEALILIRWNGGGGNKDWYLLSQVEELDSVFPQERRGDALTAFRGPWLPWRGLAEPVLLQSALALVRTVEEALFIELREGETELAPDWLTAEPGDEEEVAEWFADRPGRPVAFGEYPPFWSEDPALVFCAYMPNPDGSVTPGAY